MRICPNLPIFASLKSGMNQRILFRLRGSRRLRVFAGAGGVRTRRTEKSGGISGQLSPARVLPRTRKRPDRGRRIRPAAGRVRRSGGELCRGARGVAGVLPAAGFARTTGLFGGVAPRLPALCAEQHQSLRDGLGAQQRFSPAGKPLDAYFDKLFLSYEMKCMKPDRAIFDRMAARGPARSCRDALHRRQRGNAAAGAALGYRTFCPRSNSDWREEVRRILGAGV